MKTHHPLIGLTGPAGAGKDATADALTHLAGFTRMAFADALRAEVCAAFSVPMSYLISREGKEHPISALALAQCYDDSFIAAVEKTAGGLDHMAPRSPRWIMQMWGTEYRRAERDTYWLDKLSNRIEHIAGNAKGRPVVVTDVRFLNEAETIRKLGGVIWQVQRPGWAPVNSHASEVTGAEFAPERVIDNGGTLVDLRETVRVALESMEAAA